MNDDLPLWLMTFIKNHPSQVRVDVSVSYTPVVSDTTAPPAPPMPIVGRGDTVKKGDGTMAIAYPITMPAFGAKDAAKNTFNWIETAGGVAGAPQSIDFTTSASTGSFQVAAGSAVEYWATETDGSGNKSADSPHGTIASASDTTPPAAPAAPTVGPGDTAPPNAPMLGKGKKV